MTDNRHPDETGGGVFLALLVIAVLYSYFVIYDMAGNFKECNDKKYPLQLVCIPSKEAEL